MLKYPVLTLIARGRAITELQSRGFTLRQARNRVRLVSDVAICNLVIEEATTKGVVIDNIRDFFTRNPEILNAIIRAILLLIGL